MRIGGERAPHSPIAILALDEESLEKIGQWPWPRKVTAQLLESFLAFQPKSLSFDMIFSEPDQKTSFHDLEALKQSLKKKKLLPLSIEKEILSRQTESQSDRNMGKILNRHDKSLIMGGFYEESLAYNSPFYEICLKLKSLIRPEYLSLSQIAPQISNLDLTETAFPESWIEVLQANQSTTAESCENFLKPNSASFHLLDRRWPQLREENSQWKDLSLAQALTLVRRQMLPATVPLIEKWWLNTAELGHDFSAIGFFNAIQDADGSIRRGQLFARYGDLLLPSLAFSTYLKLKGWVATTYYEMDSYNSPPKFKYPNKIEITNSEGEVVEILPVGQDGSLPLKYRGDAYLFPHVSLAEFLQDSPVLQIKVREFDKKENLFKLKKKSVDRKRFIESHSFILGATAVGIYDLRVTPFSHNYPGVETHATFLDNLLNSDFLRNSENEEMYSLGAILLGGLLFSWFLGHARALPSLWATALLFAAIAMADYYFLFKKGLVFAVLLPLLLLVLLYLTLTALKYFTEEKRRKEIKGTFQKYVSPAIVNEVLKDPSHLELGGRKEFMTVFFSDVRGFTSISEKLDPKDLSTLLNRYLTPMTEIVFAHKGTLDKYMGDAIMAFFGAPLPSQDHAESAVRVALEQMNSLKKLQAELTSQGLPSIDIGIGINTGEMSVGNMGSETVRSYTVMGDSVNLASRLEGLNRIYGTHILISEFTKKELPPSYITRPIDKVRVKGKNHPVEIFEVVSSSPGNDTESEWLATYVRSLELYRQKAFREALVSFQKTLELKATDPVALLYIERCKVFIDHPPAADWDGVFNLTEK